MNKNKSDTFTLVYEREGKGCREDFASLELCLRGANKMMTTVRAWRPIEIRKNGHLLMSSTSIYARLRGFD